MSVTLIYEVRQRTWDKTASREIAFVTDKGMADNTIQTMYREAWKTVMDKGWIPSLWFPAESYDNIKRGLDYFQVDDMNSPQPLFYAVPHQLYNVVPTFNQFTITVDGEPTV